MSANFEISWRPKEIVRLCLLWGRGDPASQIAESLPGRTRNAVIGKARRLGLKRRPSPIIRKAS